MADWLKTTTWQDKPILCRLYYLCLTVWPTDSTITCHNLHAGFSFPKLHLKGRSSSKKSSGGGGGSGGGGDGGGIVLLSNRSLSSSSKHSASEPTLTGGGDGGDGGIVLISRKIIDTGYTNDDSDGESLMGDGGLPGATTAGGVASLFEYRHSFLKTIIFLDYLSLS